MESWSLEHDDDSRSFHEPPSTVRRLSREVADDNVDDDDRNDGDDEGWEWAVFLPLTTLGEIEHCRDGQGQYHFSVPCAGILDHLCAGLHSDRQQ